MPVKIYVSRDSEGRPWPPDYSHEALATVDIIKRLWSAFNHQGVLYAAVANLHRPSADLVLISEHGLGVAELKHYYGHITRRPDGTWYAGPKRIESGTGHLNPHEQVQAYAARIREELIHCGGAARWLPGSVTEWENFKFQTTVCFTHPDVYIEGLKESLRRHCQHEVQAWEEFSVCKPEEMAEWTATLRFEVDRGPEHSFEPYRLTEPQIIRVATQLLGGTKWAEIVKLMPTGKPYAYLKLMEGDLCVQIFGLDQEKIFLGRDANNCAVPIPQQYTYVGRIHACIKRSEKGIFIEDLDSKNSTYVEGTFIQPGKRERLEHGQQITLGGPGAGAKVCRLEFSLGRTIEAGPTETYAAQT
jgi:hypothetical protein